jgi:hypothetical protein
MTLDASGPSTSLQARIILRVSKLVRIVYLVPSDRRPRTDYVLAMERATLHLQRWYHEQLRGKTFELHDPVVETVRIPHRASWYATRRNGRERSEWFWNNLLADAFEATGGRFGDPENRWIYYPDCEPAPKQSVGANEGVAVLPEHDLWGLIGTCMPGHVSGPCRWVGGLGHELGHALGLPHPPEAEKDRSHPSARSLMYLGYLTYPATTFTPEDIAALEASPFLSAREPLGGDFSCRDLFRTPGARIASAAAR